MSATAHTAAIKDPIFKVISTPLKQLVEKFPPLAEQKASNWAQWLGLGVDALMDWRKQIAGYNQKLLGAPPPPNGNPGADSELLRWAVSRGAVIAPAVRLMPAVTVPGSTFIVSQDVPTGMYLCSIPTGSCLIHQGASFEHPPPEDVAASYIAQVEELMVALLSAAVDETDSFHKYVHYLRHSSEPPQNLPFLTVTDLKSELGHELIKTVQEKIKAPLHPALRSVPPAEYKWAMSMVLSRRVANNMIQPLIDKVNHSSNPNAYTTMASPDTMTGIDVFDNLIAGVPEESLFTPYTHMFAIERIRKAQAVTFSYSDANPKYNDEYDSWMCNWGMTPDEKASVTGDGLRDVAAMMAQRRILFRQKLFPPVSPGGTTATTKGKGDTPSM